MSTSKESKVRNNEGITNDLTTKMVLELMEYLEGKNTPPPLFDFLSVPKEELSKLSSYNFSYTPVPTNKKVVTLATWLNHVYMYGETKNLHLTTLASLCDLRLRLNLPNSHCFRNLIDSAPLGLLPFIGEIEYISWNILGEWERSDRSTTDMASAVGVFKVPSGTGIPAIRYVVAALRSRYIGQLSPQLSTNN
jgi:hypothetical protein